ncbi:MAG TPA: formate dehydrogenase accessory sulfurtransferase FdhD [Puia sp.]|jgi:FdhD protein|uniref:formate dehydrogenase accessory sulfurtransferase FdhD n=1 Tax=Puia sp. TaxID=2045100 RepID=UPI002CEA2623|nr:formate dehydrogenase accessory sulfurtransferase FdhD [Puia sp.]HVU95123.1 formate dehydrogenase accessory sulfurtransferase FdhD [Puia sp.]
MPDSSEIVVPSPGITRLPVQKIAGSSLQATNDPIAIEDPLEIRIQYGPAGRRQEQSLSVTMRTPGNDEELALGWLYTEGIVQTAAKDVLTRSTPNTITILLPEGPTPDLSRTQRHSYTSSSCGVCGKTSLDSLRADIPKTADTELTIPATLLYPLPNLLRESQDIFDATGGLHAAGLFDHQGRLMALREDIGRHNALDKLIGHAAQQQWLPASQTILLLSGRACFELIQKAAMAGIKMVVAVGPPSSLAVKQAEDTGITLVGFLRQQRFNIYSGAHRIHV